MIDKAIWQTALDVQNACNASGVIKSLAHAVDAIWKEAHGTGQGTDFVNKHPIIVLYLEQLAHLSGATLNHPYYYDAHKAAVAATQD